MQQKLTRQERRELVLRVQRNRARIDMTLRQMQLTRDRSVAARRQARRLTGQVRVGLDRAAERLRAAGRIRPQIVTIPTPLVRRLTSATPADPLDEQRRRLHEAYAATSDEGLRAELMASYDGFARSLALKYRHREVIEDLVQVARVGLLHAIDRFNPALGRPFPLFARITITGELKRHIRDKTWAMRVPRSLQEDYLTIMRAVDDLTAEGSESPSMEAVATRCGLTLERVIEALELRVSQRAMSIDAPLAAGAEDPMFELGADDTGFRQLEDRQLLVHLLSRLPGRDRRIVELRFLEEMTQSEIAAEVGVSQMCVSRVLARTLGRLRLWARTAVA
jgi:RNA polymerase sigma-B factor